MPSKYSHQDKIDKLKIAKQLENKGKSLKEILLEIKISRSTYTKWLEVIGEDELFEPLKQLSNPFATGGGGVNFESRVQTAFAVLMISGGFSPCLPCWPIKKIRFQAKKNGYNTDDLVIYVGNPVDDQKRKLLCQIKHKIALNKQDKTLKDVINAAWNDFNKTEKFRKGHDAIALITGPLNTTDTYDMREVLEWSRHYESSEEFFRDLKLAKFSSKKKQEKVQVFRDIISIANKYKPVSDDELFQFFRHFHLLGFDLDLRAGVTLALLQSLIGKYSREHVNGLWAQILNEVQLMNQNAGTLTVDNFNDEIKKAFAVQKVESFPINLSDSIKKTSMNEWSTTTFVADIALANLLGSWEEKSQADKQIIEEIVEDTFLHWTMKLSEIIQYEESPIKLKYGRWEISNRKEVMEIVGGRIFDTHLEKFKAIALKILKEVDPQFELPPDERFAAKLYGKSPRSCRQIAA